MISMTQAFKNFWKNYFNFTGTATRAEYWWMALWGLIITAVWGTITGVIVYMGIKWPTDGNWEQYDWLSAISSGIFIWGAISVIGFLAILIPSLSLEVRRYRDSGLNTLFVWILFGLSIVYAGDNLSITSGFNSVFSNFVTVLSFIVTVLPTGALSKIKVIGKNAE